MQEVLLEYISGGAQQLWCVNAQPLIVIIL
jgi:hypothetical protein